MKKRSIAGTDFGDLAIFNEKTFPSTAILAEIFWITRTDEF